MKICNYAALCNNYTLKLFREQGFIIFFTVLKTLACRPNVEKEIINRMKVVIVGAGNAGLAAAISLHRIGYEIEVAERAEAFSEVGLGYIILPNGLAALDHLGAGEYVRKQGKMLDKAVLRTPDGEIFKEESLQHSVAIKRSVSIDALRNCIPAGMIKNGYHFSHFEYDTSGKASAAVFENGEKLFADIFIAADGANSRIRNILHPEHPIRSTVIQELVGITTTNVAAQLNGALLKTQSLDESLSIGILPCNENQVIWYMQFNSVEHPLKDQSAKAKKDFVQSLVGQWPDPISTVLAATDFNQVFLWQTRDMELLPSFHHQNIILIGDAAHLALPFTSQGTNSALQDAIVLAELLQDKADIFLDVVLDTFYHQRKADIQKYLLFGRELENIFLNPSVYSGSETPIPLAK